MFRLENFTISLGTRTLFDHVMWQVGDHDRVGLVGPNGSGKSTLLRMLARMGEPDLGKIHSTRGATLGYLPQEGINLEGRSVFDEAVSVFDDLLKMKGEQETRLAALAHLPSDSPELADVLERYHHLEERFRQAGGYQMESEVGGVLKGLGFDRADWDKRTESLSGGWQMRLALAKLLLLRPSLLLLDEPTNHLDLEARDWLESFLREYPHAMVVVSHDRYFLDQVVTRVAELERSQIEDYAGNYTWYLAEKERRRAALEAAWKHQQEEIERVEAFVERFRYKASKASQVQSRIKSLEKIDRIELNEPPSRKMVLRFPDPPRSGDTVLDLLDVSKRYGDKVVLHKVEMNLRRGDKLALVGPNGAGKSTLMRILAARETPDVGLRRLGHNVFAQYFAQDQARELNPERNLLDEMMASSPMAGEPQLRTLLGAFLFTGDDIYKKTAVLSGGERNRLALCKLLSNPGNLLLLDEPTNHLDITSKDVLLEALQAFSGTVVFVSHDRYFLEQLSTRVIEVGGGKLNNYPGTFKEYTWHQAQAKAAEEAAQAPVATSSTPLTGAQLGYQERKELQRKRSRARKRVEELEANIAEWEDTLARLGAQLEDPHVGADYDRLMAVTREHEQTRSRLDRAYEEWESLSIELERDGEVPPA